MPSAIDATKPADGVPAVKSELRSNLATAKSEIEALQDDLIPVTGTPGQKTGFDASQEAVAYTDKPVASIPFTGDIVTRRFYSKFAGTIDGIRGFVADSGTFDATVRIGIGGTAVGGLSGVAMTTTEAFTAASAPNTFAAGTWIEVEFSSITGSAGDGAVAVEISQTGLPV